MRELSYQSKWQPWKGVILQVAALIMLLTLGRFMQRSLGPVGLIGSELLFLILAISYTLIQKTPLKEVFPIRKISLRDFFGTGFLWAGTLAFGFMSIYLAWIVFPGTFMKVLENLNTALDIPNPFLSFFTIAIVAPICEESIERGAVLSHFRSVKKDWLVVLIIGIFFGIMHTDPIRFINTSLMGAVAAYLMIKKDNFLLPLMIHFFTNGSGSILSYFRGFIISEDIADAALKNVDPVMQLGSSMILFCLAPFAICLGFHLLMPKLAGKVPVEEKKSRTRKLTRNYIIAGAATVLMLTGGVIMLVTNPAFLKMYEDSYSSVFASMNAAREMFLILMP
ncbi:MAG: CPBP family intramembrane metalloprotease [Clostridiales bacterium]|nr:CPBP family intramembrane metalloprotease [Clostridiales bacterium]